MQAEAVFQGDALETFLALPPFDRDVALTRARARRHLRHFVSLINPAYLWNWHHEYLADRLTALRNGEIDRLAVSMPRRHGKTELCTKLFPSWLLGCDPDVQIVSAGFNQEKAREYNRACQTYLSNAAFIEAFPATRLNSKNVRTQVKDQGGMEINALRNADEFEIVGRHGFYKSVGVMVGATGRGCHFLIVDDPVQGRKAADSPVIRRAVYNEYSASLASSLETYRGRPGRVLLVMTRWHEDDLLAHLLAQEGLREDGGDWEYIRFPAILDEDPHPMDPREPGAALWPEKLSLKELERRRRSNPLEFESLYQQRPRRPGGGIFPGLGFGWYGGPPPPTLIQRRAEAA